MSNSFENVRHLLDDLVRFRKSVPQEVANIYAWYNRNTLKRLRNINIELQENEQDFNIPDEVFEIISRTPENPNKIFSDDEKLYTKIYDQIQLLSILIKKKNCPISKIIDEI